MRDDPLPQRCLLGRTTLGLWCLRHYRTIDHAARALAHCAGSRFPRADLNSPAQAQLDRVADFAQPLVELRERERGSKGATGCEPGFLP